MTPCSFVNDALPRVRIEETTLLDISTAHPDERELRPRSMVTALASTPYVQHLLDGAFSAEVINKPYAHLIQDNALSDDVYSALAAEFPSLQDIVGLAGNYGNNEAVRMTGRQVLTENRGRPGWVGFFAYSTLQ